MNKKPLVSGFNELSAETNVAPRLLKTLWHKRKFSGIRAGHRTILFDPQKVLADLARFEVKAVS